MKKIESIENKIKFTAFGKTKPSTKKFEDSKKCKLCRLARYHPGPEGSQEERSTQSHIEHNKCDTCKTKDEKDKDLLKRQSEKLENAINRIKEKKLGRAGSVYKMKDQIAGHKKAKQEATAIRDPKTNELVVSKERIKEVTLEYVVNNLKGNEPDQDVIEMITQRRVIQLNKMKEKNCEAFELNEDDFDKVIEKFKSKPTKTYNFLIKTGEKYQAAIFDLCKVMIEEEEFPTSFRKNCFIHDMET